MHKQSTVRQLSSVGSLPLQLTLSSAILPTPCPKYAPYIPQPATKSRIMSRDMYYTAQLTAFLYRNTHSSIHFVIPDYMSQASQYN